MAVSVAAPVCFFELPATSAGCSICSCDVAPENESMLPIAGLLAAGLLLLSCSPEDVSSAPRGRDEIDVPVAFQVDSKNIRSSAGKVMNQLRLKARSTGTLLVADGAVHVQ